MKKIPWNFIDTKWQSQKTISDQSFHFFFDVVKFIWNDLKIFITNYHMIMLMMITFLRGKMFLHLRCIWAMYFLIIW
jgi:hypothetical protein